ncbi:hypothetical protein [Saccharothrix coeruleofusca]|uniref:Uncharacterized protein n=1 Tax=Saccharothrix coeruleofusca TaxID=33919 RepID=A0A918AI12_9PSEU|nr:hypothetical protein [Saccharothrix coeruleofusca]GGP44633.1 hypothetical protein GCM10010185_15450 [Saccharothrix coeruleofusca]
MSPVSRGRKGKKDRKGKKKGGSAPFGSSAADQALLRDLERMAGQDEPEFPEWFEPAALAVLDRGEAVVAARGPRQLEQAVSEALGASMHQAVVEDRQGLQFREWVDTLVTLAVDRVVEEAERPEAGAWKGPWRLLNGLLSILPHEATARAREAVELCAARLGPLAEVPSWLDLMPRVRATGRRWRLRDAYGTRRAVIAEYTYPDHTDPSVFLFDYDVSEFVDLVSPGVFDELDAAVAAWRAEVGDTAEHAVPAEVEESDLAPLAQLALEESFVVGDESREVFDNWFRARRRFEDLATALADRGLDVPRPPDWSQRFDLAEMAAPFTAWHRQTHGEDPDPELVDAIAEHWMETTLPESRYLISPRRVVMIRREMPHSLRLNPDAPQVQRMLPRWVRWLGQRAGLPEHLVEQAVAAEG